MTNASRLQNLPEDTCWELLEQKHIGRLAVAVMNRPDIFPVNYRLDQSRLIIQTAPGDKLAAATLGTSVAFEVDALDEESGTGWSIVVKGSARQIEKLDDYLHAEDLEIEPWAGGIKERFIEIRPERVTGRRIPLLSDH